MKSRQATRAHQVQPQHRQIIYEVPTSLCVLVPTIQGKHCNTARVAERICRSPSSHLSSPLSCGQDDRAHTHNTYLGTVTSDTGHRSSSLRQGTDQDPNGRTSHRRGIGQDLFDLKFRSPVRPAKWRKYFSRPPPVLEKTFPLTSWFAVEAAAILRRTFCGFERNTLRSTKCWFGPQQDHDCTQNVWWPLSSYCGFAGWGAMFVMCPSAGRSAESCVILALMVAPRCRALVFLNIGATKNSDLRTSCLGGSRSSSIGSRA